MPLETRTIPRSSRPGLTPQGLLVRGILREYGSLHERATSKRNVGSEEQAASEPGSEGMRAAQDQVSTLGAVALGRDKLQIEQQNSSEQ